MRRLSDSQLIKAYLLACHGKLDEDFITLLKNEIDRRQLVT
ncbi:sporulation histidine kinase inhibitor Sda [Bacillus alkalicellulosilyticus]|nr:sporulation histidine kinase inhibitor Sda [Bacillus alkalicellulosilyticus]